jgi:hypothetical protein
VSELETSNDNSSGWGGMRNGAGRPKGSMNPSTKERMKIKEAFQARVAANADRLFNSQFNLATGEQYLMCKTTVGTGAQRKTVTEIIQDPETIQAYINGELDDSEDEWYFISTKPANGMALDSMLDRAFGRAESKIDHTSNGETIGVTLSGSQAEQLIRARAKRSDT